MKRYLKDKVKGYYFITDEALSRNGNIKDTRDAIRAGVGVVQYRTKSLDKERIRDEARQLRDICKGRALFIINDMVETVLEIDADGVHLGQGDMPYEEARRILGREKIIGLTVHNTQEARGAIEKGADYIAVSPVFSTATKKDAGLPCGPGLIKKIKAFADIPVVAIGGINLKNARDVVLAGADAICAISAVVSSENPLREMKRLQSLFSTL